MPIPVDGDGIAGDAGFRAGQQPLLADQRVDQRRLAGIRPADDGDAHRLGLVVGRLRIGIGDVLADQHRRLAATSRLRLVLSAKTRSSPSAAMIGVAQIGHALAMLGRDRRPARRDRAPRPPACRAWAPRASALLATSTTGLPDRRTISAKVLSSGSSPDLASIDEQDRGRPRGWRSRSARACGPAASRRPASSKPAVSITSKSQVVEPGGMDAAVAGDARRVVDKRQLPADQPIEKRRLADVRPADDGDCEAHRSVTTSPEPRISSDINVARWRMLRGAASSAAIWSNSFERILGLALLPGGQGRAPRAPSGAACWCRMVSASTRLRDVGVGAIVDQQQRGPQPRHVADAPGMAVSAATSSKSLTAPAIRPCRPDRRGAHAGEQRIGAVAILLQLAERGQRLVVLAVIGELQRLRKGIARPVGAWSRSNTR